ncbi:MAG TPA: hypothetical protein VEB64_14970 [Azospirillaceae bacterium]|nr:hypothetical protein [Azospirillaceae bacterium]
MVEEFDEAWLTRRYYGGDLPVEAERCLHLAASTYADTATASAYLDRAAALAPGHVAVDLGLYRFHLYKANTAEALHRGLRLLDHAARGIGLNSFDAWRLASRGLADFDSLDHAPRFFLFSLKAAGYLKLRLGCLDEGRAMLAKVRELDPANRFEAQFLLDMADRIGREADDE